MKVVILTIPDLLFYMSSFSIIRVGSKPVIIYLNSKDYYAISRTRTVFN